MNQIECSKIAETYIRQHYSNIFNNLNYHNDDSFDCQISSAKGSLKIWIATYNAEITVGFENAAGDSNGWHTHMSLFGASNLEEELSEMSKLINSIISDNEPIIFSSKSNYYLTDNLDEEKRAAKEDSSIVIYKWSEL